MVHCLTSYVIPHSPAFSVNKSQLNIWVINIAIQYNLRFQLNLGFTINEVGQSGGWWIGKVASVKLPTSVSK
jgi:hypothetical protein